METIVCNVSTLTDNKPFEKCELASICSSQRFSILSSSRLPALTLISGVICREAGGNRTQDKKLK